jgi:hypothetical protein
MAENYVLLKNVLPLEPDREERQKYFAGASSLTFFYLPHSSAAEINKTGLYLTNIPRADKKIN